MSGSGRSAGERPNVLVVICDDLGYGDLGCHASEGYATPRIDEIAARRSRS